MIDAKSERSLQFSLQFKLDSILEINKFVLREKSYKIVLINSLQTVSRQQSQLRELRSDKIDKNFPRTSYRSLIVKLGTKHKNVCCQTHLCTKTTE